MPFITIAKDRSGKLRLRALPDQELHGNTKEKWDPSMNIQGDRAIREKYKPGHVLYAQNLLDTGRGFYRAPTVRPATKQECKQYEGIKFNIDKGEPVELNVFIGLL